MTSPEGIEFHASPHPKHIVVKSSKQIVVPSMTSMVEAIHPSDSSDDIFGLLIDFDISIADLHFLMKALRASVSHLGIS